MKHTDFLGSMDLDSILAWAKHQVLEQKTVVIQESTWLPRFDMYTTEYNQPVETDRKLELAEKQLKVALDMLDEIANSNYALWAQKSTPTNFKNRELAKEALAEIEHIGKEYEYSGK